ncbi:MAG: aminotransferase class III-fold pyridoxal phosphate-dependent enzyme [Kofleriaceae bacterium]|nr:aminotransferase class III-fold pyridoxal phosphate-dependent enzyme [Myxococcales bacterium]MCB9572925.1 aminotransferase class III-fold pyridoxal phosphate-dependent enzyme [Kofleriaceae bacterium]
MTEPTTYPFFFTWTAQKHVTPLEMTGGDGAWFTTADGARWLDLGALAYQVNAGHGRRRIVEAIQRQAGDLCLAAPTSVFPAKVELAERLLAMAPPGFSKVFFTLGGAEANENAIKIARLYTGRSKLVSRLRSYHGATLGALALTGDWRRPAAEPTLPGVSHVLDCYCDRCPFGHQLATCHRECATQFDTVLGLEGNVAAVFLEPVPGANGVLVPPPDYWPTVRAACDAHGALLVADCVLTGFGRTGVPFGFEHWGAVPDLITIAKGLTGGYAPMGAVLVHDRVARTFDERVLSCGLTSYAHPLGCAAAVETLKLYADEDLFGNAARLGPVLGDALAQVAARLPSRRSFVRGLGLLWCLELEAPAAAWKALAAELSARHLSLHLDAARGRAIFAPPLCISEAELVDGVRAFGDAAVAAFS